MNRSELFSVFGCLIILGLVTLGALNRNGATGVTLPGLDMVEIGSGDYNLTVLVPDGFGLQYHSRLASIQQRFSISQHEITIEQWNKCFDAGVCEHKAKQRPYQTGQHPVTLVSWFDAYMFTLWLSELTGEKFRLPTEEEWAYAAFTGKDVTEDTLNDLIEKRRMKLLTSIGGARRTKTIGRFGQNDWKIADTFGSVWEWTLTCNFSSDKENSKSWTIEQLSNPKFCPNRIVQGDERGHVPFFIDKVYTGGCGTGRPIDNIGFRVVKETA